MWTVSNKKNNGRVSSEGWGQATDNFGGEANLDMALRFMALLSVMTAITLNPVDSKPLTMFLL